jgi:hypothetical protein
MIDICVDEAYAFDYYSIFHLKYDENHIPKSSIEIISKKITEQIGSTLFTEIINSQEYKNLYEANKKTFDAVDKAKTNQVTAQYVDQCNYGRMIAKKDLQKRFFNTELIEKKIGYTDEQI